MNLATNGPEAQKEKNTVARTKMDVYKEYLNREEMWLTSIFEQHLKEMETKEN